MWQIEYEQCDHGSLWAFKFDHEPVADGEWHRLNAQTRTVYRLAGHVFQFVAPIGCISDEDWEGLLAFFRQTGPIDGAYEEFICRSEDGLRLWSHWVSEADAVPIAEWTRDGLAVAYQRLRRLEQQPSV